MQSSRLAQTKRRTLGSAPSRVPEAAFPDNHLFPFGRPCQPTLHSAPLRLRSPAANRPPRSPRPPANAVPSTALHLLTSADHQCHESKPLNSARLSLHSLHFVTLSFRSVGSAVQRKRNQGGASLRSRSLRTRIPTDDDLHWPQPLTGHHAMPGDLNRIALKSPG